MIETTSELIAALQAFEAQYGVLPLMVYTDRVESGKVWKLTYNDEMNEALILL